MPAYLDPPVLASLLSIVFDQPSHLNQNTEVHNVDVGKMSKLFGASKIRNNIHSNKDDSVVLGSTLR